jgi:hypothetical protein
MAAVAATLVVLAANPLPGTSAVMSSRTTNGATVANALLHTPTSLGVSIGSSGGTAITLNWTASPTLWSSGERVYRRLTTSGAFTKVAEFANLTTTTYTEDPGTSDVYYVVRAYYTNANGGNWESQDSNQVKPPVHTAALQIVNGTTSVPEKPDLGDKIVLTFSEAMLPSSFGSCATGGNSGTDLTLNASNPNTVIANGTNLTIGTIDLGGTGYFTIGGTALNSTCAWNAGNTQLTITLGVVLNGGLVVTPHTATYRPDQPATLTLQIQSALGENLDTTPHPTTFGLLF